MPKTFAKVSSGLREIAAEYDGAEFGDERLSARLTSLATTLVAQPDASFPRAAATDAELEATYRFLSNDRVTPEAILAPHFRETARRCGESGGLVIAHDTTEFNFGRTPRQDLGKVGRGQSFGFYGHFAIAIDATGRTPLGLLGFSVFRRTGKRTGSRSGGLRAQLDPTNERLRWLRLVETVEQRLQAQSPIHVMDREGDSYRLLAGLLGRGSRFVVRMVTLERPTDDPLTRVSDVLERAPVKAKREVPITARGRSTMPTYRRQFPARRGRMAKLRIGAGQVTIRRPQSASLTPEPTLTLNFVHVLEPKPPRGEQAVEWALWTTEAVDTAEQILAVVDAYRCRWRIEEYFKALKTGCRIESRQLETYDALVNALAVLAPIAWRLLNLRTAALETPERPASDVLTKTQLVCLAGVLRLKKKPPLPPKPSAREAMLGVAALGGHLRNNGDPGWIVLGRGLEDLLKYEVGYAVARAGSDQS
jgi:hypothetical protein